MADTRVLFVTHGIVINALTGISPASGEMVIVRLGEGGGPVVAGQVSGWTDERHRANVQPRLKPS